MISVLSGLRGCLFEIKSLINEPGLPATTALRPDSISTAEMKHPGPVDRTKQTTILIHLLLLVLFLVGWRGHKQTKVPQRTVRIPLRTDCYVPTRLHTLFCAVQHYSQFYTTLQSVLHNITVSSTQHYCQFHTTWRSVLHNIAVSSPQNDGQFYTTLLSVLHNITVSSTENDGQFYTTFQSVLHNITVSSTQHYGQFYSTWNKLSECKKCTDSNYNSKAINNE
jgi:hypothetical protein